MALEYFCKFSKFIKFYVPKGENRSAIAGFFSALISSVAAWVVSLAEEIPNIVVFSGNNSTVSVMRSDIVL